MFLRSIILAIMLLPTIVWGAGQAITLSVKGMTCPLCVAAVNKALRTTPGVTEAKTYLAREQAEVKVPADFDLRQLLVAIEQAGFKAVVVEDSSVAE